MRKTDAREIPYESASSSTTASNSGEVSWYGDRTMSKTKDGRFELVSIIREDDADMFSNTCYEWRIRSVETGDELAAFSGFVGGGQPGTDEVGTASVAFTDDETAVVATNVDGELERVELPVRVETVDEGRGIRLTYRNGRSITRERKLPTSEGD